MGMKDADSDNIKACERLMENIFKNMDQIPSERRK